MLSIPSQKSDDEIEQRLSRSTSSISGSGIMNRGETAFATKR
jgi:hypothetical protein